MKTILVTGANGQLGNSIRLLAGKYSGYNFLFTDVDTLDITDPAAVCGHRQAVCRTPACIPADR